MLLRFSFKHFPIPFVCKQTAENPSQEREARQSSNHESKSHVNGIGSVGLNLTNNIYTCALDYQHAVHDNTRHRPNFGLRERHFPFFRLCMISLSFLGTYVTGNLHSEKNTSFAFSGSSCKLKKQIWQANYPCNMWPRRTHESCQSVQ